MTNLHGLYIGVILTTYDTWEPMLQAMTTRKALKKLWLRENQLSGEIPKELGGEHGGLCNLQELYLSNNQLRTSGKKMSGERDKKKINGTGGDSKSN